MTARKGLAAAALALLWLGAAAGNPGAVKAVNSWTVGLSPMALVQGVPTDVKISVNDGSEMIGCVVVDLPAGFTVVSASISSVPAGAVWTAVVAGTGPTRVTFSGSNDAARLNGGVLGVFDIKVVATDRPLPAWTITAYKSLTVDSTQLVADPQSEPGPFNIIPPPASAPVSATPTPTAAPTHAPKPVATARATPAPAASEPGAAATSAAPSAAPGAARSTSPSPSAAAQTPAAVAVGPGTGAGDVTPLDVRALPAGGTVQLDPQAAGGIGMFAWMVPGLFLSLPALLLLIVLAAQGALATFFVPVTRRVLGLGQRRRPRGRPVPSI